MPTNLALDDKLIEEARRIGEHKTKKAAVTAALEEYIRLGKRRRLLKMAGTIDFDSAYDHKSERNKR